MFCKQCLYIFVVLFCVTAVVSMPRLANFSPCDPLIFCFSLTLYTHSLLKKEFFLMFMGNYWERNREREKFRLNMFPIVEAKSVFLHCSALYLKHFLQFSLGIVQKHLKKKQAYWWLKNKEPGERNVTFWSLILMFIFHEKCQSLRHVKMQNLPSNTHYFWCFCLTLNHSKDWKKNICVFMGNEKSLWTP